MGAPIDSARRRGGDSASQRVSEAARGERKEERGKKREVESGKWTVDGERWRVGDGIPNGTMSLKG
jgi:hypothetical protein